MKNLDKSINNWHHHCSRGAIGDPHGDEGRGKHEPEEDHVRRRAQEEDDAQRDPLESISTNVVAKVPIKLDRFIYNPKIVSFIKLSNFKKPSPNSN